MAQFDIAGLKNQIKSMFDTANTTTGSPIDLSKGMNDRVQQVFKINPNKLPVQASQFPCITIFLDGKDINQVTTALNQVNARRKGELELKIMGSVWENNFTNVSTDDGDEEIELLMENVEEILRSNPTLGGKVNWAIPDDITFHSGILSEETHLRAGIMSLKAHIYY